MRPGFAVMLDGLLIIGLLSYSKIGEILCFNPAAIITLKIQYVMCVHDHKMPLY